MLHLFTESIDNLIKECLARSYAQTTVHPIGKSPLLFPQQVDHGACRSGTAGATTAVDVILFVLWCIQMNDHIDMVHMQTTSDHVGSHNGAHVTASPTGNHSVTRALCETTVQVCRRDATLVERVGYTLAGETVLHEHQRTTCRFCDRRSDIDLGLVTNQNSEVVADGIDMVVFARQANTSRRMPDRIFLVATHKFANVAVEGGREQKNLGTIAASVLRTVRQDLFDLREEPHVGHTVGFIDHHDSKVVKGDVAMAEEIDQPTRCRDNNADTLTKCVCLTVDIDAADARLDPDIACFAQWLQRPRRLLGKLANGNQHQRVGATRPNFADRIHRNDAVSKGLSGAGRSFAADVFACKRIGKGSDLDRERCGDASKIECSREVGWYSKLRPGRRCVCQVGDIGEIDG